MWEENRKLVSKIYYLFQYFVMNSLRFGAQDNETTTHTHTQKNNENYENVDEIYINKRMVHIIRWHTWFGVTISKCI